MLFTGNSIGVKYAWPKITHIIAKTQIPLNTSKSLSLGAGENKSFVIFLSSENESKNLPIELLALTNFSSLSSSAFPKRDVC